MDVNGRRKEGKRREGKPVCAVNFLNFWAVFYLSHGIPKLNFKKNQFGIVINNLIIKNLEVITGSKPIQTLTLSSIPLVAKMGYPYGCP